jgi:hypothetical protein
MARVTIPVDQNKLLQCIKEAEKNGPLSNLNALYQEVARLYGDPKVTYSVVGLRIAQWKLPKITKAGKKGRSGGNPTWLTGSRTGKRTSKAEKFKKDDTIQNILKEHRRITPERFLPVVEQMAKGSRSAAVKLKCLDCVGWVTSEVKLCPSDDCPLYLFRPYRGKADGSNDEQEESEQEVA